MEFSLDKLLADPENLEPSLDSLMEGIIAQDGGCSTAGKGGGGMTREHLTMGTKVPPGIYRCNAWAREHEQREVEGTLPQCSACGGFSCRTLWFAKRATHKSG